MSTTGVVQAENAGTVYRIHYLYPDSVAALFNGGPGYYMLESGWGQNYGEWICLAENTIAWSYLAEKMPRMARSIGDRKGWVMAFEKAGVTVFGWEPGSEDDE